MYRSETQGFYPGHAAQEVMPRMQEIAQEVRSFVIENVLFGEEDGFSNDDSFFEKGLVDSMGILTLLEFIREKYLQNEYTPEEKC